MKKVNLDNEFIAEALDIELEEGEELSLQMLDEFKGGKGDEEDE